MALNLRHFFLIIIIINLIALVFFFLYQNSPTGKTKKNNTRNDPFLQKIDTKSIFGRRNATTPAKKSVQNTTANPKYIKPKKKKKEKIDYYMKYNIFQNLSLYTHLNKQFFNDDPNLYASYSVPNMGLINEKDYCLEVDRQNINEPYTVLSKMFFLTDYNADGLARQLVMRKMGKDAFSDEVSKDMNKSLWNSRIYNIPKNVTMIFTKKVKFHYYHEYNKNLFCITQMYNHIPGHGSLTRKDLNVENVNNYMQRFSNKPHCFNNRTFFPRSFRLDNETECSNFFNFINSEEYVKIKETEQMPFITKVSYGSHRGHGLEILDDFHEMRIRRKYENGKMCGQIVDNILAQRYISRPLLIDGHKFDFRIYMLIASTDPLIVYYHDGFLRLSLLKYDINSKEKSVHFTNTNFAKDIFAHADEYYNITGLNETEMRNFQMWSMEKLQSYLLDIGKIDNPNWLNDYLRPAFKKAFIHTVMMTEHAFLKKSNVFEIFGLDFILDEDLNLWFIECNASPVFQGTSPEKEIFQTRMLRDMFNIEYAYLRSRIKRLRSWAKKYHEAKITNSSNTNDEEFKQEFHKINKNKLEFNYADLKELKNNTFTKIIDMGIGKASKEAFHNMFETDCFEDTFN